MAECCARAVDKYKEEHPDAAAPKSQAVAQKNSTQQDSVTATQNSAAAPTTVTPPSKPRFKKKDMAKATSASDSIPSQSAGGPAKIAGNVFVGADLSALLNCSPNGKTRDNKPCATSTEIRNNTFIHLPIGNSAPQPSDEQVNSAIENSGITQNVEISGAKVVAPPNGRATALRTLPGATTDHVTIRDVTITPASPHAQEQEHSAVLKIGPNSGMDRVFMEGNTYCDSDSLLSNKGGEMSNVLARQNSAYDCQWAGFVNWLVHDRDDEKTNQRFLWWETRLESTWANDGLSLEQKEHNRQELKRVEGRIKNELLPMIHGVLPPGKNWVEVNNSIYQDPPQFLPRSNAYFENSRNE
jgi:hypothetical protein